MKLETILDYVGWKIKPNDIKLNQLGLALGRYLTGFQSFWLNFFKKQNDVRGFIQF